MDGFIATGTFIVCVLISIFLYRYRAFITQIIMISLLSVSLFSMSMLAYALNNKHNLWSLVEGNALTVFEKLIDLARNQEQAQNPGL